MERTWMIKRREETGLTVKQMARVCKCSAFLLENIEQFGWVTHPHIASRIANVYQMTLEEFNDLVPYCRRMDVLPDPIDPPHDTGLTIDEVLRGKMQ